MFSNTTPRLSGVRKRRRSGHRWWCVVLALTICASACGEGGNGEGAPTSTAPSTVTSTSSANGATTTLPTSTTAVPPPSTSEPASDPVASTAPSSTAASTPTESTATSGPVEQAVAAALQLPLRRKLALLMFIGFNTGYQDTPGITDPAAAKQVIDSGVGGVFIGRKELGLFKSPVFPRETGGSLRLLVATDAEGGRVDPLPQVGTPLPPAREMAQWPTDRVRSEAAAHGVDLRSHGVNVNFAPMLDLEGDPNPLGDRTWSADPSAVTSHAGAFAEGMCDSGVYPTFKHFPGHGHSDFDADLQPATTPDLATLNALDLIPFRSLTKSMAGRSMVMSGHLDVPGLTSDGLPFSLDPIAMEFLRSDVGFDGVVVTDELAEMGSITQRGIRVPEAVERAIIAGNDMALFFGGPSELETVLDRLELAVSEGRLSPERVDDSVRRVSTLMASGACAPA